jgi:hypothetical protein
MRKIALLLLAFSLFAADQKIAPDVQATLNHITAASLRGHLSFLASDLLEGRGTPSRGLDLAAEYIAAQFRRAGLDPVGDEGYFQTATMMVREPNWEGFEMSVTSGGKTVKIDRNEVSLRATKAIAIDNAPIILVDSAEPPAAERINGSVVFIADPRANRGLRGYQPRLVLTAAGGGAYRPAVVDPEVPERRGFDGGFVTHPGFADLLKLGDARVTIHMAAPIDRAVKVRNVAGVLQGSDPDLRDTYVMLTAHYDHLGMRTTGDDKIFNGANDDGSGTVSVIEVASALAAMKPRPKRSVLFVTFFGEELGLVGSRYYGRHPLIPLDKTIADLNLEQVGRTDAANGRQLNNGSVTGFDFSDLPRILVDEGEKVGIKVYKDSQRSDQYFQQSDNQALADVGIPAHTLCVAFEFNDYHQVSDHWQKIDYENMARVDRAVTLGLLHLASEAPPPKWNESVRAARPFVEAAKKLYH